MTQLATHLHQNQLVAHVENARDNIELSLNLLRHDKNWVLLPGSLKTFLGVKIYNATISLEYIKCKLKSCYYIINHHELVFKTTFKWHEIYTWKLLSKPGPCTCPTQRVWYYIVSGNYVNTETIWLMRMLTLNEWGLNCSGSTYHGGWCPGLLRRQENSTHDIDCVA